MEGAYVIRDGDEFEMNCAGPDGASNTFGKVYFQGPQTARGEFEINSDRPQPVLYASAVPQIPEGWVPANQPHNFQPSPSPQPPKDGASQPQPTPANDNSTGTLRILRKGASLGLQTVKWGKNSNPWSFGLSVALTPLSAGLTPEEEQRELELSDEARAQGAIFVPTAIEADNTRIKSKDYKDEHYRAKAARRGRCDNYTNQIDEFLSSRFANAQSGGKNLPQRMAEQLNGNASPTKPFPTKDGGEIKWHDQAISDALQKFQDKLDIYNEIDCADFNKYTPEQIEKMKKDFSPENIDKLLRQHYKGPSLSNADARSLADQILDSLLKGFL